MTKEWERRGLQQPGGRPTSGAYRAAGTSRTTSRATRNSCTFRNADGRFGRSVEIEAQAAGDEEHRDYEARWPRAPARRQERPEYLGDNFQGNRWGDAMGEALTTAQAFYDAFATADVSSWIPLFADDCITVTPAGALTKPATRRSAGPFTRRSLMLAWR